MTHTTPWITTKTTPLLHPYNRTTWVSRYQKDKTSLDLNEARDDGVWGCSGISWTICKQSALHSRQITTPTPHHSIFTGQMLFLTSNQQSQSTEGKPNQYKNMNKKDSMLRQKHNSLSMCARLHKSTFQSISYLLITGNPWRHFKFTPILHSTVQATVTLINQSSFIWNILSSYDKIYKNLINSFWLQSAGIQRSMSFPQESSDKSQCMLTLVAPGHKKPCTTYSHSAERKPTKISANSSSSLKNGR